MGSRISKSHVANSLFQLISDFIAEINIAEKNYNYNLENRNIVDKYFANIVWGDFGPYSSEVNSLYFKYETELDYFINKHAIPNIRNTINTIKSMQKIKINNNKTNKIDHNVFTNCEELISRFKCNPYLDYKYDEKEFSKNTINLLPADLNKCSFYTYRKENFARTANNELEDYLKIDKDAVKRNSIINYSKKELKNDNYYQYSSLNSGYSKYIYIKSINKIIEEFR